VVLPSYEVEEEEEEDESSSGVLALWIALTLASKVSPMYGK
jgi:hypothetical protein